MNENKLMEKDNYHIYGEGFSKLPYLPEEMLNMIIPLSREEVREYVPVIKSGEEN